MAGQEADVLLPATSLIVVVMLSLPVAAYLWIALTVNGPRSGPVTVPTELEPSPHAIVALWSDADPVKSASVKVAVVALNDVSDVFGAAQLAEIGASATFTVEVAAALTAASLALEMYTVLTSVPGPA